jgi:hypothetical protein
MSDLGSYTRAAQARKALLNRGARHFLDDGREDAAVAQHEAGHALVARLLGFNPTSVTVEPGANFGGMTRFDAMGGHAFDRCVVWTAGSEAERLFGSPDDGCKDDLRKARAIADDDTIERARRVARSILKANFIPLTVLAVALIDRRTLDLAEIEEAIAANSAVDDDAYRAADDDDDHDDDDDGLITVSEFMRARARADRRLVYYE